MDEWLNGTADDSAEAPPCPATERTADEFVHLALVEGLLQTSQRSLAERERNVHRLLQRKRRQVWWNPTRKLAVAAAVFVVGLCLWAIWFGQDKSAIAKPNQSKVIVPASPKASLVLQPTASQGLAPEDIAYHNKLSGLVLSDFSAAGVSLGEALQMLVTMPELPVDLQLPTFSAAAEFKVADLRSVTLRLNCISFQSLVQLIAIQAGCRAQRAGNGFYLFRDGALADADCTISLPAKEAGFLVDRQHLRRESLNAEVLDQTLRNAFDETPVVSLEKGKRYQVNGSGRLQAALEEIQRDLAFPGSQYVIDYGPIFVIKDSPLHQKIQANANTTGIAFLGIYPTAEVEQSLTDSSPLLRLAPVQAPQGTWMSCAMISVEARRLSNDIILLKNDLDALQTELSRSDSGEVKQEIANIEKSRDEMQTRMNSLVYAVKIVPHKSGKLEVGVQVMDDIDYHILPENSTVVFSYPDGEALAGIVKISRLVRN